MDSPFWGDFLLGEGELYTEFPAECFDVLFGQGGFDFEVVKVVGNGVFHEGVSGSGFD